MNRRTWIAGLAALFVKGSQSLAATKLIPLDAAAFREMTSAHRGKILLVDFWATWCAPCRQEFPHLVALHAALEHKGLDLVTISCDEPEQEPQAAEFVARQNAPLPCYIRRATDDDAFINAIDPKWSGALPALFLFDRTGRQVQSFIGETDMKQLESTVRKLLP